jgi:hypothetical protein
MLAEIFMVRLETSARAAQEAIPASNALFVPFYKAGLPERIQSEANSHPISSLDARSACDIPVATVGR